MYTQLQELRNKRDKEIVAKYLSTRYSTEAIAIEYGMNTRAIQRIARKHLVVRTKAQANKVNAKLKQYYKKPEHYCSECGRRRPLKLTHLEAK